MVQGPACWDLGGDQIIPTENLGTEYIALRGYLSSLTDNVFITAINNNTSVNINGAGYAVLNTNQTIAVPFSTETMYISATDKVYAFQLSGFGCEIGLSTIPSIKCRGSSAVSFTRSSDADLILLITTQTGNEGAFSLNGAPLAASSFSYVPATTNQWMYARLTIPVSQIPALSAGRLVNSAGLFHLGIIHGSTESGGARFGYFSDYAVAKLDAFPDASVFCGTNGILDAGPGFSSYTWNTGASSQSLSLSTNGLYKVTVKDKNGCVMSDSSQVTLQTPLSDSLNVNVCSGQNYQLPWGVSANATGIYRDTLRYVAGCDSIRSTVALQVSPLKQTDESNTICGAQNYILPWGTVVQSAGVYRDTLRNTAGCDSIRQTVRLSLLTATSTYTNFDLCEGKTFTLPSGKTVNNSGIYQDTLRTSAGCDSIIRTVTLDSAPDPEITISKSNDIDCTSGAARLQATGGLSYSWFPITGLNDPSVSNPFASPMQTTWYHVTASSDKGCLSEDSILVVVSANGPSRRYAIPNAFTPNGDGKNDCFGIDTWGVMNHCEFAIFNRWGQQIFYTTDPSVCWDGRYRGKDQPAGTYVFQIRGNNACGELNRKGTVTLIR
jgi:gliding motility-associated-like protein